MNAHLIDNAQVSIARTILSNAEVVEVELLEEARALTAEAHEAIRLYDALKYRKPPLTLSVKSSSSTFGPRIVWVSYTSKRYTTPTGAKVRFTTEITGRRNGKYPKHIFKPYEDPLRSMLWDIECRAADLRERISYWRETVKRMKSLAEKGAS